MDLKKMRKEVVVVYFKELSRYLPAETEENHDTPHSREVGVHRQNGRDCEQQLHSFGSDCTINMAAFDRLDTNTGRFKADEKGIDPNSLCHEP
jgi:hypothetical protein